jgi:hypothetical protein
LNRLVSQLIEVINSEILCLEGFLNLLSEEQRFLVEKDIDSLGKCIEEQAKTIRDQRELEEARIKLTDSLAAKLKIDKQEVNISKLIELVEESYSTELRELQGTLASLYAKLERQRKKNEFLIKQSMRYADKSIKVFLGLERKDPGQLVYRQRDQQAYSEKVALRSGQDG